MPRIVDAVVILCGGAEIARHPRCYGEGVFVSNPLHYLALIETKPNALDQAAALQDWDLPEVFQHLRYLLEARTGNRGKREFIQVLRLLEALPRDIVTVAVTEAITLGAIGFDAVKLIALARIERRPARLDLLAYPHPGLIRNERDDMQRPPIGALCISSSRAATGLLLLPPRWPEIRPPLTHPTPPSARKRPRPNGLIRSTGEWRVWSATSASPSKR